LSEDKTPHYFQLFQVTHLAAVATRAFKTRSDLLNVLFILLCGKGKAKELVWFVPLVSEANADNGPQGSRSGIL
jgi:hypothetical protein